MTTPKQSQRFVTLETDGMESPTSCHTGNLSNVCHNSDGSGKRQKGYKIGFTLQSILIQWNYENRRSISYMCVQELSDEKEEE